MRCTNLVLIVFLLAFPALAQESASYKLNEHTFNAGGNPSDGVVLTSTSYKITLDSIGDTVAGSSLASASFRMEGSFAGSYPPPGEVRQLRFVDFETLEWDPERSVGDYGLYSGSLSGLPLDYGVCETDVDVETVVVDDPVPFGECLYYLVTARNRLGEEGTKGFRSSGPERPNDAPCP